MSPQQLSRQIAPDEVILEDVFVTVDPRRSAGRPRLKTERLERIADPLGDSRVRSLFGRAWERDREVHDLVRQIQSDRGNWLLIGDHGSGKTTLFCESIRHGELRFEQ